MKNNPKLNYAVRSARRRGDGYDYKISREQYQALRNRDGVTMTNEEILAYLNASCGLMKPIVNFIVEE